MRKGQEVFDHKIWAKNDFGQSRIFLHLISLLLIVLLLSACQTVDLAEPTTLPTNTLNPTHTPSPTATLIPTETPFPTETMVPTQVPTALPEGVERFNMMTQDGANLVGFLHRAEMPVDENLVVILAHGWNTSHSEWEEFEPVLFHNGITTMTFDFRGHGESGGINGWATIGIDVQTVADFLRSEGFERIACIGSSRGGLGCLVGATLTELDGFAMLSSRTETPEGNRLFKRSEFTELTIPKVFMIAENDYFGAEFVEKFLELADLASEPKEVHVFPGALHGSALLYGSSGEQAIPILLEFVTSLAE